MTTDTQIKRPIPRKLDDTMIEALSTVIAEGNYYITACSICGISEPCFYGWLKIAEEDEQSGLTEDESRYIRLVKSLKKAEAEAEANFLSVVSEAATIKREWLPAMTFLERRHPDRWGRKDRIQPGGNTYNINIERALVDASGKLEAALGNLVDRQELTEGGVIARVENETSST